MVRTTLRSSAAVPVHAGAADGPVVIIATSLYVFEAASACWHFHRLSSAIRCCARPCHRGMAAACAISRVAEKAAAVQAPPAAGPRLVTLPISSVAADAACWLSLTSFDNCSWPVLNGRRRRHCRSVLGRIKYQLDPLLSTASTLIVALVTVAILLTQLARVAIRSARRPDPRVNGDYDVDKLEMTDVQKRYGSLHVVRDFDLHVQPGEFVTFLGPSGSGKTTALKMIAGFETPSSGDIFLDGRSIVDLPPYERGIGMVFQNYALYPHMTVAENVAFPLTVRHIARSQAQERVCARLQLVKDGGTMAGAIRTSFPAGSSSASRWRAPSCSIRAYC